MLQCVQYNGLGECYQWIEIPVAIPALPTCSSLCSRGHGTDANSPTYNHWGASVGEGVVCLGQLPCPCPWVPCEALLGISTRRAPKGNNYHLPLVCCGQSVEPPHGGIGVMAREGKPGVAWALVGVCWCANSDGPQCAWAPIGN